MGVFDGGGGLLSTSSSSMGLSQGEPFMEGGDKLQYVISCFLILVINPFLEKRNDLYPQHLEKRFTDMLSGRY